MKFKGNRLSTLLAACAALAWLLAFAGAARGQNTRAYTEAPLPKPENYVTDTADVLDSATEARLATILKNLKDRADIEFAVVAVPTTGDVDIFEYSLSLSRGWGIGSKEGERKGLLLVLAVNDRKWRVQVSRHLEGDLPDGLVGEIARQRLVPQLRQNNYSQGIGDFVQATIATLAEKRGFQLEGIDQSYAYRAPVQRTRTKSSRESGIGIGACCLIIIVVIILFSLAGGRRGGRGGRGGGWGGGGGGWLSSILIANAIGSVLSSGRQSSSGWGGGDGGGSGWSGGDGGFGGFGGGGDFGGGGAGGDW